MNFLKCAIIISGCFVYSGAIAKEINISCTMNKAHTTTTNPVLDQRLNSQNNISVRRYIFDDSTRSAWILINGEKRKLCQESDGCSFQYSTSLITRQVRNQKETSNLSIDRISGSISEDFAMLDANGRTIMFMTFAGDCKSEAGLRPKF